MAKQPNSRFCFVCGVHNPAGLCLHFYDNDVDEVRTRFTIQPAHQGFPGVVHGGITAAILDEVGGRVMTIGNPQRLGMTAKLAVRYRQPVPLGQPLLAVGRVHRARGRLLEAHAQLLLPTGDELASADLLIAELPPGKLHLNQADLDGWQVYPDPHPAD